MGITQLPCSGRRTMASEWPGGLVRMLQSPEAGRDLPAELVDAGQGLVAELDQDARGGERGVAIWLGCGEGRVRDMEPAQRGSDAGLERGEPGELALEGQRVARGHRSRSRVSASMTRTTTSRSTSLRFLRAVSRSAAVARRSRSRMAPTVASWSSTVASEAKTSRVQPARSRRRQVLGGVL